VNNTYDNFYNFLYGLTPGQPGLHLVHGLPADDSSAADYDGVEFRLTKTSAKHWNGMVSYTYSRLWGNYTGLTSSDEADGAVAATLPITACLRRTDVLLNDNGVLPADFCNRSAEHF